MLCRWLQAKAKIPSTKDIQKKLDKPLGALPNPKDLANKAKVNTPNADNLASKVAPQHDHSRLVALLILTVWSLSSGCSAEVVLRLKFIGLPWGYALDVAGPKDHAWDPLYLL